MGDKHLWGDKHKPDQGHRCDNGDNSNHGHHENKYDAFPRADYSNNRPTGKKPQRQKTLSMANPILEEALNKIGKFEKKLNNCFNTNDQYQTPDPEATEKKSVYNEPNEPNGASDGDSAGTNDVFAKNLQVGNGNFMVFCENVDNCSEIRLQQIGDKNVIININSCCNKCQILDDVNKQVVPLDSEGEIWLEIKRRSLKDSDKQPTSNHSDPAPESPTLPARPSVNQDELNDLSGSARYFKHARVPSRPRRTPIKQTPPSPSSTTRNRASPVENDEFDNDPLYDKIIEFPGGRLAERIPIPTEHEDSTDFAKQRLDRFLDNDSVKQYMSAGGEDFELSVCTWTYEKDDVYVETTRRDVSREDEFYSVAGRSPKESKDVPPRAVAPPPPGQRDPKVWYKDSMDKKLAHDYLRGRKNGAFLVRKATTPNKTHKYTIEFIDEGKIRRLKILQSEYGFHFEFSENKTFDNLPRLINAIQAAGLEIKEEATGEWKTVNVFPV